MNRPHRTLPIIPLALTLLSVGCQQVAQQRASPRPTPAPPPPPPKVEASHHGCGEPTSGLIKLTKTMPKEVVLGEEFSYDLNATANGCAGHVVVQDHIPSGFTYVRSEPAAEVSGDHLRWEFHEMDAGQSRPIRVWLKADKEGTMVSCATVSADPRTCASVFVGKPLLAIDKSGPETAQLGQDITYNIVVSNRGSTVARNVVVTDQVPDGLSHSSGQSQLRFEVGDLAPNQSRTIPVVLKANKRGRICNPAVATSSNAGRVSDEACTTILKPGLNIVKTGDKEQFINRTAKYQIKVTNVGDTTLTSVVVTDTAPAQTSIVEAPGASVSGNTATWTIGSLPAGQERTLSMTLTSKVPGNLCNRVSVAAAEGLRESSEACTLWKGLAAVLLEVVDDPDPVQIGETTTYTIRVTNQGTADLHNIKTTAEFDAETTPVSSPEGRVDGQKVTFPNVPVLAPKQAFTYTIRVRGAKEGDARNRVTIVADELTRPVVEEESTRAY